MSLEKINKAAYEVLSSMPEDEAKLVLSAIVYDTLPPYIEEQTPLIQKHVDAWISKRYTAYERYLKRQYIERVRKHEDTTDLEQAYETISKARFDDRPRSQDPWTPEEARFHPRGSRGRFTDSPYKIHKPIRSRPLRNPEAVGIPDFKKINPKLNNDKVAQLQSAYLQVLNTLKDFDAANLSTDAKVKIKSAKSGVKIIEGTDVAGVDRVFTELANAQFKKGDVPTDFIVSTSSESSVKNTYFDALSSIPGTNSAGKLLSPAGVMSIQSGGENLPTYLPDTFSPKWFSDDYALSDNDPRFRRLKAGAELVDTFVPATAWKTKAAVEGAKYVGALGPEAEKIIGPTARKLTYRSRGTEKKEIDPELLEITADDRWSGSFASVDINPRTGKATPNKNKPVIGAGFDRKSAILGWGQPRLVKGEIKYEGQPGSIIRHFQGKLPNKDYWELQRKSGAVPPSEGVVIDAAGKIVSQSVGFKDDHYLPFNIKALSKLRGGEYIRTRSTGGPTTEDVYTALISGAKAFTVVSRSGSFTVEFDDSFTGRRRYNDKAGKMVERYGKLLDAAGSGEVTLVRIDPKRAQEIDDRAREDYPASPIEYERRKKDLLEREKVMPQPSQSDEMDLKRQIKLDLKEDLANKKDTSFVQEYEDALKTSIKNNTVLRNMSIAEGGEIYTPDPKDQKNMLDQILESEVERRYPEFEKKAMRARSYKAMQLDGQGYFSALKALQEQYPYYIKKDIIWHPVGPETKNRDLGYVRPRFLRSSDVWEGYFDPEIKGPSGLSGGAVLDSSMARHAPMKHGKTPASRTNYQNMSQMKDKYIQETVEGAEEEKPLTSTPGERGQKGETPKRGVREPISKTDLAIMGAFKASRGLNQKMGDKVRALSPSNETNAKELPMWANPALHHRETMEAQLANVVRDPDKKAALVRDLEVINDMVGNQPGWDSNKEEFDKFYAYMRTVSRSKQAPPFPEDPEERREIALSTPTSRYSIPSIESISNRDQLYDAYERLKPVADEIHTQPGEDPDSKISHYIIRQQTIVQDEMSRLEDGQAETSAITEAYKKAEIAHAFRALTVKWEQMSEKKFAVREEWFTGGPDPKNTVVHQELSP